MESTEAVKRGFRWSSISFTIRFLVPYFWGICALVFIQAMPEGADLKPLFFPPEGSTAVPVDNLYATPVLLRAIRERTGPDVTVISPDAGGVERARAYAKRLGASLGPCSRIAGRVES